MQQSELTLWSTIKPKSIWQNRVLMRLCGTIKRCFQVAKSRELSQQVDKRTEEKTWYRRSTAARLLEANNYEYFSRSFGVILASPECVWGFLVDFLVVSRYTVPVRNGIENSERAQRQPAGIQCRMRYGKQARHHHPEFLSMKAC